MLSAADALHATRAARAGLLRALLALPPSLGASALRQLSGCSHLVTALADDALLEDIDLENSDLQDHLEGDTELEDRALVDRHLDGTELESRYIEGRPSAAPSVEAEPREAPAPTDGPALTAEAAVPHSLAPPPSLLEQLLRHEAAARAQLGAARLRAGSRGCASSARLSIQVAPATSERRHALLLLLHAVQAALLHRVCSPSPQFVAAMQRARPDRPRRLGGYFQAAMRQGCDILRRDGGGGGGPGDGGDGATADVGDGDGGARCGVDKGAGGGGGDGGGGGREGMLEGTLLDAGSATVPGGVRARAAEQVEVGVDEGVVGGGGAGGEERLLSTEASPLADDFVTLVLLPLLQALPPPSLIDPVTAKAALALASANEASDAAMDGTAWLGLGLASPNPNPNPNPNRRHGRYRLVRVRVS